MNLDDLTKLYDFSGRSVVLTGGTGVLGAAMAAALAGCGANLALLNRDTARAEALIGRLPRAGGRVVSVQADVLQTETLSRAMETVVREFGQVDCLVNGAGGNQPGATTNPDQSFFQLPEEALRAVFDLNLLGAILPCQVFGAHMAGRGQGAILNVSSMNAFRPLTRIPAYSAAKASLNNFTQWLAVHMAQEYSPRLRVNAPDSFSPSKTDSCSPTQTRAR
jgi:NAD(P)-dependent dehydrogenase (short-subunit alcohol dehydrogenase family)